MRRVARAIVLPALVLLLWPLAVPSTADARVAYYGFTTEAGWTSPGLEDVETQMSLAEQAHANVVRLGIGWATLESTGRGVRASWYVERLDAAVAAAARHGLRLVAAVSGTPCWASTAPDVERAGCEGAWWDRDVSRYAPSDPEAYADAVAWLLRRYPDRIAALEVWNEPDDPRFWTSADPAADYVRLVRAVYPAAKAAAPSVPVLVGSLSGADVPFLQRLWADGITGAYDAIAVHPYTGALAPDAEGDAAWRRFSLLPGLAWLRAAQAAAGDTGDVWLTELGWATSGSVAPAVSEAQQAAYVRRALGLVGALPYVRAALVYTLRETSDDPGAADGFGVVRRDYSPKPAYAAVTDAFASLALTPTGDAGAAAGRSSATVPGVRAAGGRRGATRARLVVRTRAVAGRLRGRPRVRLACLGRPRHAPTCRGVLRLTYRGRAVVGSVRFAVAAGHRASVVVPVGPAGRRLLASGRTLVVRALLRTT